MLKRIFQVYTIKRFISVLFLKTANFPFIFPTWRSILLRCGGVDIGRNCYVYSPIYIDTVAPERVHIGDRAVLTSGSRILTHFINPSLPGRVMRVDDVYIGADSFIGTGVIICNSVRIGDGAIVGAGSVVTKDIPEYEVWAGNPARFIKKRARLDYEG